MTDLCFNKNKDNFIAFCYFFPYIYIYIAFVTIPNGFTIIFKYVHKKYQ